jgi:hypothetical protein
VRTQDLRSLVPKGRLNFKLVQITFPMIGRRRFSLKAQALRNVLDKLVEATNQVPKGRNNQEPGTEVPGKHIQRIESRKGRQNDIRLNQPLPGSTLTPNLISQAKVATAARPIKSTLQSQPIR